MPSAGEHPNAEDRIDELKASIGKYLTGEEAPTAEALGELTRAVHQLADHVLDLHRRFEKAQSSLPEWTTHGWDPPSGGDPEHS